MARRAQPSLFKSPFLKSVEFLSERVATPDAHPFNLPALTYRGFRIDFTARVTVIAGPNGSGKSTIIDALAALCGFARHGGNRDFATGDQGPNQLADALRPAWLPRVTTTGQFRILRDFYLDPTAFMRTVLPE